MATLKDLYVRCKFISEQYNIPDELKQLPFNPKHRVYDTYLQDGMRKSITYCTQCKTFSYGTGSYINTENCLCNDAATYKNIFCSGHVGDEPVIVINDIFPNNNSFIFSVVTPVYEVIVDKGNTDDFDYLKNVKLKFNANSLKVQDIAAYINGKGFYSFHKNNLRLSKGRGTNDFFVDKFSTCKIVNLYSLNKLPIFQYCLQQDDILNTIRSNLTSGQNNGSQNRSASVIEEDKTFLLCDPKDIFNTAKYQEKVKTHQYLKTDSFKGIDVFLGYCPKSNSVYEFENTDAKQTVDGSHICPYCNTVVKKQFYNSNDYRKSVLFFEKVVNDDLVLRIFETHSYFETSDKTFHFKSNEEYRVFFGIKKLRAYRIKNSNMEKIRIDNIYASGITLLQSEEEIVDIIKHSSVKNSGFIETAIEKESYFSFKNIISYMSLWYKYPQIELFSKCGLFKLCDDMYHGEKVSLNKGTDPKTILGIGSIAFKLARKHDLGYNAIMSLQKLAKIADGDVTEEVFNNLQHQEIIDKIIAIYQISNIPVKRILKFIDKYEEKYDIGYENITYTYLKYLTTCQKIGYDLSDKHICFPDDMYEVLFPLERILSRIDFPLSSLAEQLCGRLDSKNENSIHLYFEGDRNTTLMISLELNNSKFVKHAIDLYLPPASIARALREDARFVISKNGEATYLFSFSRQDRCIEDITVLGKYGKKSVPEEIKKLLENWFEGVAVYLAKN